MLRRHPEGSSYCHLETLFSPVIISFSLSKRVHFPFVVVVKSCCLKARSHEIKFLVLLSLVSERFFKYKALLRYQSSYMVNYSSHSIVLRKHNHNCLFWLNRSLKLFFLLHEFTIVNQNVFSFELGSTEFFFCALSILCIFELYKSVIRLMFLNK